jgi:hypothetical protein
MDEARVGKESDEKESDKERRHGNLVLLAFFVVLVGIGLWLVNALFETRRIDDCIAQHQRNCNPIELPPRQ